MSTTTEKQPNPRKLLTPEFKRKVEARVRQCLEIAQKKYPDLDFETMPEIRYDIKNRFGGIAITGGRDDWTIRLNLILAYENEEDFIKQTVGHEVAHLIQRRAYGATKVVEQKGQKVTKKIRSHGPEWRECMILLGLVPHVTHKYDTSSIEVKKRHRAKKGSTISPMELGLMLKRLENGVKRLPPQSKEYFLRWLEEHVENPEGEGDEE